MLCNIADRITQVLAVCALICTMTLPVIAETCDLGDSDFPSDECSFSDLGTNIQMLKFGQVDTFVGFGSLKFIRIGSAQYDFANAVNVYEIESDGDCEIRDENDLDNLLDDVEHSDDVEVAFLPSPTDLRVITDIWILNCNIAQDR